MDVVALLIIVSQTQHVTQGVWQNIPILGIVTQLPIQQNISVATPQPIVEIALAFAYCQRVEHEFKIVPLWMINSND